MKVALLAIAGPSVGPLLMSAAPGDSPSDRATVLRASAEKSYCETLSDQYDRYRQYIDFPSAGRANWRSGDECQKGDYAGGERLIEQAIQELGFAPLGRSEPARQP